MKEVVESTVTTKGQITIPQRVRKHLEIAPGDRIEWHVRDGGSFEIRKARQRALSDIVGLLGKPKRTATVDEMDAGIRARVRESSRGGR